MLASRRWDVRIGGGKRGKPMLELPMCPALHSNETFMEPRNTLLDEPCKHSCAHKHKHTLNVRP